MVTEVEISTQLFQFKHMAREGRVWMCPRCRDDKGAKQEYLVCTDTQHYNWFSGPDKQPVKEVGLMLRAVCPKCANEYMIEQRAGMEPIPSEHTLVLGMFNHPHRPAWLTPNSAWIAKGASRNIPTPKGSDGPISKSLQQLRERVAKIRAEYNSDVNEKPVLFDEMTGVVVDAVNCMSEPENTQVDENQSIYEYYDPYQE